MWEKVEGKNRHETPLPRNDVRSRVFRLPLQASVPTTGHGHTCRPAQSSASESSSLRGQNSRFGEINKRNQWLCCQVSPQWHGNLMTGATALGRLTPKVGQGKQRGRRSKEEGSCVCLLCGFGLQAMPLAPSLIVHWIYPFILPH